MLDHLPLALELAASRLAATDAREMLQRMREAAHRPSAVAGTLERTVDWALSLLPGWQREALARASAAFIGSFDARATAAVLALPGPAAFEWLESMIARSLIFVRRDEHGHVRYRIYDAVALAAARSLTEAEVRAARERHAHVFASAWTAVSERPSGERRRWTVEERENLRAARTTATDPRDRIDLLLAEQLERFASDFEDDARRIDAAIELARSLDDRTRLARLLLTFAKFHRFRGRLDLAIAALEEALRLERRADLLVELGRAYTDLGDEARAVASLEEGLAAAPHDRVLSGHAATSLGILAFRRGAREETARCFERARADYEASGELCGLAVAIGNLAALARLRGDLDSARVACAEAAAMHRASGNLTSEALQLGQLGTIERLRGRLERARELLTQARRVARLVGNRTAEALAENFFAQLELACGNLAEAERAFGRARAIAATCSLPPNDREQFETTARELEAARQTEQPHDRAWLIDPDGRWFRPPDGERIELGRRRSAGLVLCALAALRLREPGATLSVADTIEAGWPGERILPRAARQRVYVLVNTLRRLGFTALETTDQGYRFDPAATVRFAASED